MSLERLETPPQPFATIPFCRDPDFVNRGDTLDQVHQRCSEPAARVALVGLGGVGYAAHSDMSARYWLGLTWADLGWT